MNEAIVKLLPYFFTDFIIAKALLVLMNEKGFCYIILYQKG